LSAIAPLVSLKITNQLSEVGRMSLWLDEAMRQHGVPEDLGFKLDLCANEAVTNIISYAFSENGKHEIMLQLSVDDSGATLVIMDDGVAFNLLEAPEHVQPATLEEAEIGGLGILLIRRLMHRCTYERQDGRNVLRLSVLYDGLSLPTA